MVKIKRLSVQNFRGIRLPIEISFVKGSNSTSALVYGRNGSGKSSLADAWEWFLNFTISHLGREGISANDFPHKASNGNECKVVVSFEPSDVGEVEVVFNRGRISQPDTIGEHRRIKDLCKYPNYLRYSDLQDFVFKTKTEKYKYLAKFFGLEQFTENHASITAVHGRLSTKLDSLAVGVNVLKAELKPALGEQPTSSQLVDFLSSIALKHRIGEITGLAEIPAMKDEFHKVVASDPSTLELTQWKSFAKTLGSLYPIERFADAFGRLEVGFASLKADSDLMRQIYVEKLLETALSTIPKLGTNPACPLCESEYDGNLLEHVEERHATIKKIVEKKHQFDREKAQVKKQLSDLLQKLGRFDLTNLPAGVNDRAEIEAIRNLQAELPDLVNLLSRDFLQIDGLELSTHASLMRLDLLIDNREQLFSLVNGQVDALENDSNRKSLADDYGQFLTTIERFSKFQVASRQKEYLDVVMQDLQGLLARLTSFIQQQIEDTFAEISDEVMECFNGLEGGSPIFRNPKVLLVEGKDRAVELDIEFAGEQVRPAFKFLSESQINSFGLSIFLAAVKHFNRDFKFFVLDDVVNSFDAYKRPRVSSLLNSRFVDFQVLILTHDLIFFDTLQRAFPNWNRYRFTGWDYTNGPATHFARNYHEEIQARIDSDDGVAAGQALGRYLEHALGLLCESAETPVKYRLLNTYTLAEFYDPLSKRLRDKLKKTGFQHKLLRVLDAFDPFFRNYSAHWKNEASPLTAEEIQQVFNQWKEIDSLAWCDSCKAYVKYEKSGNVEHVRCGCGLMDLKQDDWYEEIQV